MHRRRALDERSGQETDQRHGSGTRGSRNRKQQEERPPQTENSQRASKLEKETERKDGRDIREAEAGREGGEIGEAEMLRTGTWRRGGCVVCLRAALLGVDKEVAGAVMVLEPTPEFDAAEEEAEAAEEEEVTNEWQKMLVGFLAAAQKFSTSATVDGSPAGHAVRQERRAAPAGEQYSAPHDKTPLREGSAPKFEFVGMPIALLAAGACAGGA
ncbi:hypothetical protein FB451DRAFT_1196842 [Mycena latifolia]|nr:hypothetical protein FB451DRAFT_1196842 [Mycena latifolia]